MQYVADLHLHSKYSRAVSQNMTLPIMAKYAVQKGLHILSASDFTHPLWFKEIKRIVTENDNGLLKLKYGSEQEKKVSFLLSTEISSIYTQNGKLRRIHNLIFVPDFIAAEKITKSLVQRGCNVSSDGRPIIGMSSKNLLELILEIDERCLLIPCHVWTPHFGLYGSASGFNSITESFGEMSKYIYGIETGLSSDPEMNWQIPELKDRAILSFSDAHSPAKMGREATIFELEKPSYDHIRSAIQHGHTDIHNRVAYTVEFYPEEGKYHFSGHRNCKVSKSPTDIKKEGNICPVCKRRMTEGVFYRLQELSGRDELFPAISKTNSYGLKWFTDPGKIHPSYVKLVPLLEIVAESMSATVMSEKVKIAFVTLCNTLGTELDILLKLPIGEIQKAGGEKIAEGVQKVREGTIAIQPGFDGEYGVVKIWHEEEKTPKVIVQESLLI